MKGKETWKKGERPNECSVLKSGKRDELLSTNLDDDIKLNKNGCNKATLDNPQLGLDTIQVSVQSIKTEPDIVQVSLQLTKIEPQLDTHQDMVQVSLQFRNEIGSMQHPNYVKTPNIRSTSNKEKATSDDFWYVQSNPSYNHKELYQVGDKPEQTLSDSMKIRYDTGSVDDNLDPTGGLL